MSSRFTVFPVMSALWFSGTCLGQVPCPNPPPVVISDPQPPTDVCLPLNVSGVPFQFFDDFSWRSFVALVCAAQSASVACRTRASRLADRIPRVEDLQTTAGLFHKRCLRAFRLELVRYAQPEPM